MTEGAKKSNVVIITAKGNNTSIADKNLIPIEGKPFVAYPIMAGRDAKRIDHVYITTNCEKIAAVGREYGCRIIMRPPHLCTTESHHGETITHAINEVKKEIPNLGTVTILLGNTVMVDAALVDLSVEILEKNPELDSSMSIWLAQDDHPYRALALNKDGLIESYLNKKCGTSRQEYPTIYFYDQGVWTLNHEVAAKGEGPEPWTWMGKNVFPILRNWVTGKDVHTDLDVAVSDWWIRSGQKDQIMNQEQIRKACKGKE